MVWGIRAPTWADDAALLQQARDLWDQGLSTTAIGRSIGVTKNQVVGVAHRRGWPSRPSPIRAAGSGARPKARPILPKSTLPKLPSAEVIPMPVRKPRKEPASPVVDEKPAEPKTAFMCAPPEEGCTWVEGSKHNWVYCQAPVHGRRNPDGTMRWFSYCSFHMRRAYVRRSDVA